MNPKFTHLSDNRGLYGGAPSGNKRTTNQNAPFQISTNQNEPQICSFLRIEMPPHTTDVIYCDFIKAIDKEPHHRLLKKLESYGIRGNVLDWTAALLAHRTQRVRVNNSYSDRQDVISEIPKGSVIDPLLFVIFINDLPNVVSSSDILLFADGMKFSAQSIPRMTA